MGWSKGQCSKLSLRALDREVGGRRGGAVPGYYVTASYYVKASLRDPRYPLVVQIAVICPL